jgi:hypothetical protein
LRSAVQVANSWQFETLPDQFLDNNVDDARQLLFGLCSLSGCGMNGGMSFLCNRLNVDVSAYVSFKALSSS